MAEYRYPIPYVTSQIVRDDCPNPGLLFDRYVGYLDDWSLKAGGDDNPKRDALAEVCRASERLETPNWQELRAGLLARWRQVVTAAGASVRDKTLFKASPIWRFVTGIGRDSALEVGFSFDRVNGLPIVPGSSLKGLTRAYVIWSWADEFDVPPLPALEVRARHEAHPRRLTPLEQLEEALTATKDDTRIHALADLRSDTAMSHEALIHTLSEETITTRARLFQEVFGTAGCRGRTVFFDAIPEKVCLEIDVITPHYPDYYEPEGREWPTSWQNPNPVPFLTIGHESVFHFAVAGAYQEQVAQWLRSALDYPGAGAKTSAGYGAWQPDFFTVASEWRAAVIREINPSKQIGVLEDQETGDRIRFRLADIEPSGITPGKKWMCQYSIEQAGESTKVRVRNARRPTQF